MLTFEEWRGLQLKIRRYFSLLVEHSFFYDNPNYREAISEFFGSELGLFRYIAAKANESAECEAILADFRRLYHIGEEDTAIDYSSKTDEELMDEVNYLRVCVKNICGIDLDNFDATELRDEERIHSDLPPDSVSVFHNLFDENLKISEDSMDQAFGDLLLKSQAYERLNRDINDGIVYIYKTRPRINLLLKYFLMLLLSIGLLFSMLVSGLTAAASTDASSNDQVASLLWPFFSLIYCSFSLYQLTKTLRNDNFKYSWQRRNSLAVLGFSIMLVASHSSFKSAQPHHYGLEYLSWILFSVLMVSCLIYLLSYFFLQPERDNQLIDSVLEKYISELSSKGVSFK